MPRGTADGARPSAGAPLRPLLPAAPGPRELTPAAPKRKREMIGAACNQCQARKVKCDGQRPTCAPCQKRSAECLYKTNPTETQYEARRRRLDEIQEKGAQLNELFTLLRSKPREEAQQILDMIRRGDDPQAIISHVTGANVLLQLSGGRENPPRYEFPFLSTMPTSIMGVNNPYIKSVLYDVAFGSLSTPPAMEDALLDRMSPYYRPYLSAELADPRLQQVRAAKWTSVTTNDQLFRKLLNAYFLYHYPSATLFIKDYMLQDMVTGRTQFCSPLLVNAVLAAACQTVQDMPDRAKFWLPHNLPYAFLAESKRLWELEIGERNLTTIQALALLDFVSTTTGTDKVGWRYLAEIIAISKDMKLFQKSEPGLNGKIRRAREFTAWALFIWQATRCFYYFSRPFLTDPPEHPLPEPSEDPEWYGEIWLRYPHSKLPSPMQLPAVLCARTRMRAILNEIARSFASQDGEARLLSLEEALSFKLRLDVMFRNLPPALDTKHLILPVQLSLHMEYHSTMISLFRPYLEVATDTTPEPLSTSDSLMVEQIVSKARICLETLLRLYYARHNLQMYDPFAAYFSILLSNLHLTAPNPVPRALSMNSSLPPDDTDAARALVRKESRASIFLCMQAMHSQGKNFMVGYFAYRAMRQRLAPEDALLLGQFVVSQEMYGQKELSSEHLHSHWPMPIIKLNENPDDAKLSKLVQQIDGASISDDNDAYEDEEPTVSQGATQIYEDDE